MTKPFGVAWFVTMVLLCWGCGSGARDESNDQPVLGPCSSVEPFCQKYKGHSWSDPKADLSFEDAKAHCSSIKGRLPTISELRTLIVECPSTQTGGACQISDTCTSEKTCGAGKACVGCGDGGDSVFLNNEYFWSSTPVTDPLFPDPAHPDKVWSIIFRYSDFYPIDVTHTISAYCIAP